MDRVEGRRGRGVGVWVGAEGAEGDMHVAIIVEVGEREDVIVVERRVRREDGGCFQELHFHCFGFWLIDEFGILVRRWCCYKMVRSSLSSLRDTGEGMRMRKEQCHTKSRVVGEMESLLNIDEMHGCCWSSLNGVYMYEPCDESGEC